jgi:hypothetical protein
VKTARAAFDRSLTTDLEQAKQQKDANRTWAQPTPEKKKEIGSKLAEHKLTIKQAQAQLKRAGLQHGRSTGLLWRQKFLAEKTFQVTGRPSTWNADSQAKIAATAIAANVSRNSVRYDQLTALAYDEAKQTLTDRGVSSLGVKKPSKKQVSMIVNKTLKMVKPQITTHARWIACRCVRNAIALYVICRLVFFDSALDMWIQGCNKWNFDMTTIRFGFTTRRLTVAISRTQKQYREVEIVGSKNATLPHAVKLASLQSGGGVAGDIILLFKVKVGWFGKAIRELASHVSDVAPLEGSKGFKKFAATTLRLTQAVTKCWNAAVVKIQPLLSRCIIPTELALDLVVLTDFVFIRVPIPGLTSSLGSGRPGFLYLTTKSASPAMYSVLMMKHHLPTIKRVRDTGMSTYPRSVVFFFWLIVCMTCSVYGVCSEDPRYHIPERCFLSMDGEPASLGVIFDEPTIRTLEGQQTEVVVGSANATRVQNSCDAGGVFFLYQDAPPLRIL